MSAIRHSPYETAPAEFRIGLGPIAEREWFEPLEGEPVLRKDPLLALAPELVWGAEPGSEPAQSEALRMIASWRGADAPSEAAPGPLWAAARLVEDDLCLMQRRDGEWRLTAASLCAATYFTAEQVVGKSLHDLHGPVPGFNASLLVRVTRIFDALPSRTIVERRNWTVTNAGELFLPDPATVRAELAQVPPHAAGEALFVRVERQTLRRLPQTEAVLFTIRVWRHQLAELRADPLRLQAFRAAWDAVMSDSGAPFRGYKRLDLYDPLVRAFLAGA